MELIDTHCHIDVEEFERDRNQVMVNCQHAGVTRLIVPAVMADTWPHLQSVCDQYDGLYPAYGLHPIYIAIHRDEQLDQLRSLIEQTRPVAVGEIGLDFYIDNTDKSRQQRFFEAQLEIARDTDLPVILHVRKAHDQVLSTLRKIGVKGGTSHAFNGSLQQAHQYIDMGFKLGFGGMLTYERSSKLRALAKTLPLDSIVLETDAPDMTVASHRGERNSPEYLPECLAALAEIKELPVDDVAEQTTRNAIAVFQLAT